MSRPPPVQQIPVVEFALNVQLDIVQELCPKRNKPKETRKFVLDEE
jgi:hypothetical protein